MSSPLTFATGKRRIVDATVLRRELRLQRPLRGATSPLLSRSIRVLWLAGDDGLRGAGEASRIDWLAGGAVSDDAALDQLAERLRRDAPPADSLLAWSLDPSQPPALRSAVQTALLDLDARRRGTSVAALLGAAGQQPPLALSALVGDDDAAAMARQAARYASLGIASFKVKVGAALERDVENCRAVRAAIGPAARLCLDANGAWTVAEAERALAELAPACAALVEEPLRDASQLARLRSPIAVAVDESVRDAAQLEPAIARGGFSVLVLKLARVGGPLPALRLARRAMQAGIEVVFTDSIESAVGRAATLHTAAAARAAGVEVGPVGLGGLFVLDDGARPVAVAAAAGPGLGIEATAR